MVLLTVDGGGFVRSGSEFKFALGVVFDPLLHPCISRPPRTTTWMARMVSTVILMFDFPCGFCKEPCGINGLGVLITLGHLGVHLRGFGLLSWIVFPSKKHDTKLFLFGFGLKS